MKRIIILGLTLLSFQANSSCLDSYQKFYDVESNNLISQENDLIYYEELVILTRNSL